MRRVFGLLQAIWLALLMAEPVSMHACKMHASGHASHVAAPAPVDHSAHDHAHHETGASVPEESESTTCQCLGNCCAAATAALTSASDLLAVARQTATHLHVVGATDVPARAPDLRLPLANGPPQG